MKIGFIGLGKMGSGLARNLIRSGYDVLLFDINPQAVKKVSDVGGIIADAPAKIGKEADVVFTSLPLPQHLIELLITSDSLLRYMNPGSVLIDVSTIDPGTARLVAEEAQKNEVEFLACPLGKGPAQAEESTEPIFAGGKKEVFNKYKEILGKIGNPVSYLGDVEQSTAFKLISNMVGMANLSVLSEGFQLAEQLGIDPKQFKELMHDTGANSAQLSLRGPLILDNNYTPMFSVDLAEKDVRLGVEMAEGIGLPVQFSKMTLYHLQEAQKISLGGKDAAAVYQTFSNYAKRN
ncbi:NAD(P)-dependent oxidoreductase [Cytobacillus firmus]|uniref:NAD(P)-dependent oxidoreductase n=1 Tax=Cytobacillus firmus TaxID=1399 RepID=UPI001C8DF141|nr:NAD(P)-dependent oxidoreductase [Cytobacillus firmus]MBX9972515.1 NAD(P)-dependent oxidoreductase [Cytobacillus firmus]